MGWKRDREENKRDGQSDLEKRQEQKKNEGKDK